MMKPDKPRAKSTLLGKLLARINAERQELHISGMKNMLARNNLTVADPGSNGYYVEESTRVSAKGVESTQFKLWRLVDMETVTLQVDINKITTEGFEAGDRRSISADVQAENNGTSI